MTQLVWFPGQLVFIDETSKYGRTLRRSHGRSLTGAETQQRETALRGRRISVLGLGVYAVSMNGRLWLLRRLLAHGREGLLR